jgi:hypothetical protein
VTPAEPVLPRAGAATMEDPSAPSPARPFDGVPTAGPGRLAGSGAPRTAGSAGSGGAVRPDEGVTWRTVADDGWVAAQAAAEPADGGTTETGLPRRVPMAQLVPGGVETEAAAAQRRTPESVRGLLSAYHRGVQRGRTDKGQTPEPTTTRSQTTQRGKEQEA